MRLIQTNDSEPFHNNIGALFSQNILAVVAPLSYVIPGPPALQAQRRGRLARTSPRSMRSARNKKWLMN